MLLFQLGEQVEATGVPAGDVITDMHMNGRTTLVGEQMVEGGHAVGFGGRDGQALADIGDGTRGQPAKAVLHGMEGRQQQMPLGPGFGAAKQGNAPLAPEIPFATGPGRDRLAEHRVHRQPLGLGGMGAAYLDIHAGGFLSRVRGIFFRPGSSRP